MNTQYLWAQSNLSYQYKDFAVINYNITIQLIVAAKKLKYIGTVFQAKCPFKIMLKKDCITVYV